MKRTTSMSSVCSPAPRIKLDIRVIWIPQDFFRGPHMVCFNASPVIWVACQKVSEVGLYIGEERDFTFGSHKPSILPRMPRLPFRLHVYLQAWKHASRRWCNPRMRVVVDEGFKPLQVCTAASVFFFFVGFMRGMACGA